MGSEVFLGDLQEKLLERYAPDSKDELALSEIRRYWEEIAGPISKHSYPAKFDRGELSVYAEHAAYMQELQLLKRELQKRIKEKSSIYVKKIKILRKKIERAAERRKPQSKGPLSAEEVATLQKILEQIL